MNTFLERSRLSISTTLRNTCGRWLVPSMERKPKPQSFGPNPPAICWCMATLKNWSQPSRPCPPLPQILERAGVCLRKRLTTLAPMPSACGIRRFAHKACISAVALLKRRVRRWWRLASSARACAGPLRAWMLYCLCALACSTTPTTISGRDNHVWLLNHPQPIHTHQAYQPLDNTVIPILDFWGNYWDFFRVQALACFPAHSLVASFSYSQASLTF